MNTLLDKANNKTLIFTAPVVFKRHPNITVAQPHQARIEAIIKSNQTYFYASLKKSAYKNTWFKLFKELGVPKESVFYLTKEDWIQQVHTTYYQDLRGEWNDNFFWTWGDLRIRYSIKSLIEKKAPSPSGVITEVEAQLKSDPSINWNHDSESWPLLNEVMPKELVHFSQKLHTEITFRYLKAKSAAIKPAKQRMTLVINGPASSGKSRLSELIFQRLEQRGILKTENISWDDYQGVVLGDKLPRGVEIYEGIRFEEFGPEHFNFTLLQTL